MDAALIGMTDTTSDPTTTAAETLVPRLMLPPVPRAPNLLTNTADEKRLYWDRSHYVSPQDQKRALEKSATLYIGNLSFSTRSRHVYAHFSQVGMVKTVIMGLDRLKKTPCGFCFVEFFQRRDALDAVAHLSGTKLDGRVIRVELDAGFQPGRQYGRGRTGGQVRDDRRGQVDAQRKRERDTVTTTATTTTKWGDTGTSEPSNEQQTSESYEEAAEREESGDRQAKRRKMD